jgi:hypothetical protein
MASRKLASMSDDDDTVGTDTEYDDSDVDDDALTQTTLRRSES